MKLQKIGSIGGDESWDVFYRVELHCSEVNTVDEYELSRLIVESFPELQESRCSHSYDCCGGVYNSEAILVGFDWELEQGKSNRCVMRVYTYINV